jgi:hypothetical protein
MTFTESLLLRKGHFLSRKSRRLFKKYFFRFLNGAFKPRKKGTFFTFKKSGGHMPHLPPGSAASEYSLRGDGYILALPKFNLQWKKKSFSYAAAKYWNEPSCNSSSVGRF